MKLSRLLPVVAVLAAGFLLCGSAAHSHAQCAVPYGTEGFPYPGWLGFYGSPYSLGQIPVPPYFSLHPPVYYSQPVARSYGYSPYAYPGTMPYEYFSDEDHLQEWLRVQKDPQEFQDFLNQNIYDCQDHDEYVRRNGGIPKMRKLRQKELLLHREEGNGEL